MPRDTPSPPATANDWLQRTGVFGTYLFAAFALLGITPASVGLALLTLAFVIDFRAWRTLARDPLAVTALVFALYAGCHSLATYLTASEVALAEAAADAGSDWIKLLLFIPFGYWAGGRPERVRRLLFLALMGFALGTLRKIEWAQFDAAFFTTRFEDYLPAIAFGMFTGLGAVGLISLREHFWHPASGGVPRWIRVILWLLLLAMMLEGLVLSFSRGSWISFASAAVLLAYLEWRAHRRTGPVRRASRGTRIAATGAVAVFLAILVAVQHENIGERLRSDSGTFANLMSGDFEAVQSSSSGLRAHALRFAADLWSERPWFGWGAGSSRYLLAHSERPKLIMWEDVWLPHLHNTYAEILVQLGALGLALAAAQVWLLVRAARRSCRSTRMPRDLCRFFAAVLVFVLLWNLINYRVVRHDYTFFWIIFAGAVYSFHLRALLERERQRDPAQPAGDNR